MSCWCVSFLQDQFCEKRLKKTDMLCVCVCVRSFNIHVSMGQNQFVKVDFLGPDALPDVNLHLLPSKVIFSCGQAMIFLEHCKQTTLLVWWWSPVTTTTWCLDKRTQTHTHIIVVTQKPEKDASVIFSLKNLLRWFVYSDQNACAAHKLTLFIKSTLPLHIKHMYINIHIW